MKALVFRASPIRYLLTRSLSRRTPWAWIPLRLQEVPEPETPPGWKKARVLLSGICGSDMALLWAKSSPRLAPFFSFPAILGHEIVAEVEGTPVVVNPLLTCADRELPFCPACARGDEALCENVGEGGWAPGMLGYSRNFPGGWGEFVVAREERLYSVPRGVPTERALLAEPLAVVLRGLRIAQPSEEDPVLVLGAGTLGLLTLLALRLRGHRASVHVVARYPLQAEMARKLGFSDVHADPWTPAQAVGARSYRAPLGPPAWRGGFPYVVDAAGTASSLDQALWTVAEGGTILLLGAPGHVHLDLSPLWFRGLHVVGTYTYSSEDFAQAVEALPSLEGAEKIVTHVFPLWEYRKALDTVRSRSGIKVAFRP